MVLGRLFRRAIVKAHAVLVITQDEINFCFLPIRPWLFDLVCSNHKGGVAELGEVLRDAIVSRLAADQQHSQFLMSLAIGDRMRVLDPSILLGPIGAVRAAHAAISPV